MKQAPTKAIRKRNSDYYLGVILIVPTVLILVGLVLYPVVNNFFQSFTNENLLSATETRFVGLANYVKLLQNPQYWQVLKNTFVWTFGSLAGQVVLGLLLALLFNLPMKGRSIWRGLYLLPWLVPTVVTVYTIRWMLGDLFGIVNSLLMQIGLVEQPILWFGSANMAMFSSIATNIWRGLPFVTVSILAGLQSIPADIYEASKIDGATPWQEFWKITLPLIRPVVLIVIILRTIWIFNFFDLIYLLTGGGPSQGTMILPVFAHERAFVSFRMGEAATITVTMFIFLAIFSLIYFKLDERTDV